MSYILNPTHSHIFRKGAELFPQLIVHPDIHIWLSHNVYHHNIYYKDIFYDVNNRTLRDGPSHSIPAILPREESFVMFIPVQVGGDEPKGSTPCAFIHSYMEKIEKSVIN